MLAFIFGVILPCVLIVRQQSVCIIERFGRFNRIVDAGLGFYIPIVERKAKWISLKIMQLDVPIETKTEDNVFIDLMVSVQYRVLKTKVFEASYMLENPEEQLQSFIFDLVRAEVPKMILDDVFSKKDDLASAVKRELAEEMNAFGYQIIKTLVTDIQPDKNVKHAMNEINTSQRLRMAAIEKGEAEKIVRIKQAEASAESDILQGRGISGQRREIIEGLAESVEEMTRHLPSLHARDALDMVALVQYFDMLRDMGSDSKSSVVFVPHSPGNLADIGQQIRETIFSSHIFKENKADTTQKTKKSS